MDHFVTLPTDANGILLNVEAVGKNVLQVAASPFAFEDVFVYSHGWWTTGTDAMLQYSTFSVGFTKVLCNVPRSKDLHTPSSSLGIGVHWPSAFTEDKWLLERTQLLQGGTYWTMERRADSVGLEAVFALLYAIFESRFRANVIRGQEGKDLLPLRLNLIGHSFGCRVVCSALNRYFRKVVQKRDAQFADFVHGTRINLVLLQAAQDYTFFDENEKYAYVPEYRGLRILVTRSDEDLALGKWYDRAEGHNNILSEFFGIQHRFALGNRGFDDAEAVARFGGGVRQVVVSPGFHYSEVPKLDGYRAMEADLTKLHRRQDAVRDEQSGTHSDIFNVEVYNLLIGFAFQSY